MPFLLLFSCSGLVLSYGRRWSSLRRGHGASRVLTRSSNKGMERLKGCGSPTGSVRVEATLMYSTLEMEGAGWRLAVTQEKTKDDFT